MRFKKLGHRFIGNFLDLLDLVRRPETIEEVQEWYLCFESGQMAYQRQIHDFLDGSCGHQRESCVSDAHHVRVISEDRQRLACKRTCRDMEDRRNHLTSDLVHVWDHEKQSLRCREGSRHRTAAQCSMDSACGSGFGLHFYYIKRFAEKVVLLFACPFIRYLSHV